MNKQQPVESTEGPHGGRSDNHPAFGVAIVSRAQGTGRTLFQSDLRHNQTIHLSIHTAERGRHLNSDWVHARETLVEVEMSLAQWGALVSSIGIGSGVPVTLRRNESGDLPDLPYEPRIAESVTETRGAVTKLLAHARKTFIVLEEAITGKQGAKAVKEALRDHRATLVNAEANAGFAVTSLTEAAESVVSQARADIEAHILTASVMTGSASIEAPHLPILREVEE